MLKTLQVLVVVANTFFVPSMGTPNCENPEPLCPNLNEIYDTCLSPCPPRYCGVNIAAILCARTLNCTGGCRCRDGTLRDGNGVCIPEENCPKCHGMNEMYDVCPVKCPPQRCGVDPAVIRCRAPPQPGSPDCEPGCRCVDGYLKNDGGVCVPPEECSKPTSICKENEEWSDCISTCNLQNCSQLGFPIPCESSTSITVNCVKGCTCKQGYLRADDGNCIPIESCPSCGGDRNAEAGCGNCGRHCSDIGQPPGGCAAVCKYNDCKCRQGFVFDDNLKKCVLPKECTPTCGKNESFSICPIGECRPKDCKEVGFPIACPDFGVGGCTDKPRCICKEGFVKNKKGICVSLEECPSCGGDPNAQPGCGVNCNKHCSDLGKSSVACIEICFYNSCDCKDGFYHDDNTGKCVKAKDCTPQCNSNEVYSDCINRCSPLNCSQLGFPIKCPNTKICSKGCICKDGMKRADNGTCVPVDQCPSCGGDPNAVSGCGGNCKRCSDVGKPPRACTAACTENACDCRDGFVYDEKTKKCVKPEDCMKCTGPNEYFACKGACDNVCAKLHEQNQTHCPIINKKCNPMCYCDEGYARDKNNICIPIKLCSQVCGVNERYVQCPSFLCEPQKCSELGFPQPCPIMPPDSRCPDKPACICIDGYLRDDRGVCIPKKSCPSCGGDPNAVSGCGINCGRLCSNYNKGPVPCPKICRFNACDCKPGFVFDENTKTCVRPKQCTPICKENEVYSGCTNGGCDARNCSQLGHPVPCIKIDPKYCIKGCICKEGYLRDSKGICIPQDQCLQCGLNERYDSCPDSLCSAQKCSELGFPIPCPGATPDGRCPGPPGCVCNDGYVRNDLGTCIPVENCPSCGGDPNAVSGCGKNCGRLCSNYDKGPVACTAECNLNACDCRKEFVFDENIGRCVRPEECTPTCPTNQTYDLCVNGGCRRRSCDDFGILCIDPFRCEGGCRCKSGYLLDSKGNCIATEECPRPTCGDNEVYDQCSNGGCKKWRCSQLGRPDVCIDPIECIGGCICTDGYLRNDEGICVPESQCPQCGLNERYDSCPDSLCSAQKCSELGFPIPCPGATPDGRCPGPPGCVCNDGYARNDLGTCIPVEKCPSCGGDPNAVSGCGKNCGRLCSNYDKGPVACTAECNLNACDCRKEFVFDENIGKCVRPEECTPSCSKNQTYDFCVNSGCRRRSCADFGILCIDPLTCQGGCRCKDGYLLDTNGDCIAADECPKCGINEKYEKCPSSLCSAQKCSELGFPIACPATANDGNCAGPSGCVCQDGYLRNDNGDCVPIDQCPSCGGDPNAVSGCGIHCGNLCSNYNKGPVACPLICKLNSCDCRKGFVFDQNTQKCVLPSDCTPTCPANEVYDSCANGGCSKRDCSQINEPIKCVRPKRCKGGCICAEGFLRNAKGICVPINKCPRECNRPHEYYEPCSPICPPQTCESIGKRYSCPLMKPGNCEGECRCKKGFYRNKIGDCISETDCLKCTGPNEFFSCGGACDNVCSNIHKQNQTHCPIINIKCNPMCYCLSDYARDENGVCIPIDECPKAPCGRNEQYEECPSDCEPRKCTDLGFPISCEAVPESSRCNTSPACVCKDGYLRNEQGACVPRTDCPSCGGDPNAVTGCGNHCGRRCSDYNKGPVPCPLYCISNGCDCKEGYVFDDNIGRCVLPEECTEVCGINQVYDICANGGCRRRKCTDLGGAILCIDPIRCIGGCRCSDDHLLAEDGSCVPVNECPSKCPGLNEIYACQAPCDNECETLNIRNQTSCPLDSIECKCFCAEGTARDEKGICIPIEDCPDQRCGANERYEENPATFCEPLDCTEVGFPIDCPIKDPDCELSPLCVCDYGFVRNTLGHCVPKTECPSCGGDVNAVAGCGVKCGNTCSDYDKEVSCILICYRNGCDCRKGFVYDEESKKCIRPEDCPVPCSVTEPPTTFNNTEIKERLNIASITITGEFVYQLLSGSIVTSFVASGTSLLTALAQIAYFSIGQNRDQLLQLFNLHNTEEIKSVYPEIITDYEIQKDVTFVVADKCYSNINYPLSKNFIDISNKIFHASGENVDFANKDLAAKMINSWVENQTRDKIKDLVNADMFSSDTRLVCVNAIYFLGNWQSPFNPKYTETKDFYIDDTKTVQIPIMYQQGSFNYYEDDGLKIQALEMQYKGGNFSFLIILPREKDVIAVKNVAGQLRDPANFKKIIDNMNYAEVRASIPRMLIETRLDMAEMLKKANVTEMFNANSNGFRGILENDEPIFVSDIVQKAFIAVDETGTEAAAATAVVLTARSASVPQKVYTFDATRRFIYYILLNKDPLFFGCYLGK